MMQEMLFRRTCKLVELETARRNAEKAKPVKKAAVSVRAHVSQEHAARSNAHASLWPAGVSNALPKWFSSRG